MNRPGSNYPSYIIHVKKGYEDRERSIIEQFARLGMACEWILDYDIADLSPEVLDRYQYRGRKLGPAEISCSLKHIGAWEKIAAGSSAGAFVFEDDVLIDLQRFKAGFTRCCTACSSAPSLNVGPPRFSSTHQNHGAACRF
jgi:glycosyl transferase family 25